MKRSACVLMLGACVCIASTASAQERDAQVLRPGEFRLSAGAEYVHFARQFSADGTEAFGAELGGPLTPDRFAALAPLASELETFFAATGGDNGIDPRGVSAGELDVDIGWNTRYLPLRLSAGLLPRVELGVQLPVFRNEWLTRRFDLASGNIGVNPDAAGNAALLETIDPALRALGESGALPLEGSPLGQVLQARVYSATQDSLMLPSEGLRPQDLDSLFGVPPLGHVLGQWRPGDLEVDARIELVRTFGPGQFPDSLSTFDVRITAGGGLRFPTGQRTEAAAQIDRGPATGVSGSRAAIAADLFLQRRFWISGGGSLTVDRAWTQRISIPGTGGIYGPEGLVIVDVRRDPGNQLELWLRPRLRITEEMAIGGSIELERWGSGIDEIAGTSIEIPGRSRTSAGFSVRYSTLPSRQRGHTILPVEIVLGFSGAVGGSEGVPVSRRGFLEVSVLQRLWRRDGSQVR